MEIKLQKITIRELTEGYYDDEEAGVRGYNGNLDIRPPYQREFIYDNKKRDAVITTVKKGYPLNVMYWAQRDNDAEVPLEVMDGQQRTISICQYVSGEFAHDFMYFHNLTDKEKDDILGYELMVYMCSGNDKEKLDWFQTINIAGMKLTDQELRNAVYAGPFVSDAKRYFSRTNCPAYNMGKHLINGSPIRQDFLETAIKWIANSLSTPQQRISIEEYMAQHQHDPNASQLWQYFNAVITWIGATFNINRRKNILKGLNWGMLYDKYHDKVLDSNKIDSEITKLLIDSEVENKKGICPYILTGDEKQKHRCNNPKCPRNGVELLYEEMEGDHIIPWSKGGRTVMENCQMLCRECNRRKGSK